MAAAGGRDYSLAALAVLMLLSFVAGVAFTVWSVAFRGDWGRIVGLVVGGYFNWWIGMGAWRRTVWGRRDRPATGGR